MPAAPGIATCQDAAGHLPSPGPGGGTARHGPRPPAYLWGADTGSVGERGDDNAGAGGAGAGDVNADGFDDLIIGAYGQDAGMNLSGAAYLILGGP